MSIVAKLAVSTCVLLAGEEPVLMVLPVNPGTLEESLDYFKALLSFHFLLLYYGFHLSIVFTYHRAVQFKMYLLL